MPEGDAIHRIANAVAPRLVGKTIERVTTQGLVRALAGRTVESVEAHGKHLVIALDDGTYLRAHLGMNGRFRQLARADGEALVARMSPGNASLVIVTDDAVYLWRNAPQIEISHRRAPRHGLAVAALGPDVLADDFDSRQAASRAALHESRTISDLLLDQHVVAGIGNIYKCEALFRCRVHPATPSREVPDAVRVELYEVARKMMRASVEGTREDYFVYSRAGLPCRTCNTPIRCAAIGTPPRFTWWCDTCQPAAGVSR